MPASHLPDFDQALDLGNGALDAPVLSEVHGVACGLLLRDPEKGWLVATGDGALWLEELEVISSAQNGDTDELLQVGARLGYTAPEEIFRLRRQVADLEARLGALEAKNRSPE